MTHERAVLRWEQAAIFAGTLVCAWCYDYALP